MGKQVWFSFESVCVSVFLKEGKKKFPLNRKMASRNIPEDYEQHPRWGQPKQEGARKLSRYEYYFGPEGSQSASEQATASFGYNVLLKPAQWFHSLLEKTRVPEYPWYHRRYRRVPTIEECYFHDDSCKFEANIQMARDREVETEVVAILRRRAEDCKYYEGDHNAFFGPGNETQNKCRDLFIDYEKAAANLYIKYGDMAWGKDTAEEVLMKQKHRLIWERRHGPLPTIDGFKLD